MKSNKIRFGSIDEYIATFPKDVQKILKEIRATIKAAAPNAEETISYQMPAFKLNGMYIAHFSYSCSGGRRQGRTLATL